MFTVVGLKPLCWEEVLAAGNSAGVEEKTEAAEIQLTPTGYLCLVTSYGNSVESTTSVLEVQNWKQVFLFS